MNTKEKISALCKARHTNVRQLELKLGFTNGTISKWRKGTPTIKKMAMVAAELDVPLGELVGDE